MSFWGPWREIFDLRLVFGPFPAVGLADWDAGTATGELRLGAFKRVAVSWNWSMSSGGRLSRIFKREFPQFFEKVNFYWKTFDRRKNGPLFSLDSENSHQETPWSKGTDIDLEASRRYEVLKSQKWHFHWNQFEGKTDTVSKNWPCQQTQRARKPLHAWN